jgi:hypothetical protein
VLLIALIVQNERFAIFFEAADYNNHKKEKTLQILEKK